MVWPELVPPAVCTTPVTVRLEVQGIQEDGSPKEGTVIVTKCNYAQKSKWAMDDQRRLIQLQATALFPGDIAPQMDTLSGTVTIGDSGTARVIHAASRARNPDGTVNYTCLELM